LKLLAEDTCQGRLLALGGGGYNRNNLAEAWTAVVAALLGASA
jgi:acetoin utilization protein AcuC